MEDSLELPDENEEINVNSLLSPQPAIKDSRENTPPHSLAYSNSTCVKERHGQMQLRSPLLFQSKVFQGQYSPNRAAIVKNNNQNYPINYSRSNSPSPQKNEDQSQQAISKKKSINQMKTIKEQKRLIVRSKNKSNDKQKQQQIKSSKEYLKNNQRQDREGERKTLTKNESIQLKKKIKQLQQALHIETVISQQLRTKLSVSNAMLQSKLRESGLQYFFNLKNSSRDLKNVDIFVLMSSLQKSLTEKMIIIDRQKNSLKQANLEIQKLKSKQSPQKSPARKVNNEVQHLIQEKETLMSYIDEQKATMKRKIDYIVQLQSQVNRLADRQSHYTNNQRPKLLQQLNQNRIEIKKLQQELQTSRMQFNFIQINYKQELETLIENNQYLQAKLKEEISQKKNKQKSPQKANIKLERPSISVQIQKVDEQKMILLKQLDLLKQQRDHYQREFRKRCSQSSKLYALELKLAALGEGKQTN